MMREIKVLNGKNGWDEKQYTRHLCKDGRPEVIWKKEIYEMIKKSLIHSNEEANGGFEWEEYVR